MATESRRSDMADLKVLESGRNIRQMLGKLRQVYLSADEMREIITVISAQAEVTAHWNRELMYIERNGILAGLEYDERFLELEHRGYDPDDKYDRQELQRDFHRLHPYWEGRGGENYLPSYLGVTREYANEHISETNDSEPWLVPILRDQFIAAVSTQWTIRVNSLDPLSQIGAMGYLDDAMMAEQWQAFSDDVWTKWAETKGNNAVIRGGVKKGKTNFALLLAEKFIAKGYLVLGNIPVQQPPERYKYCPNLSTLLIEICKARLEGLKVIAILDEAGLFWKKIDTVMKQSREMAKLVLVWGKLHTNVIVISHQASDLATAYARTVIAEFEKTSEKSVHVHIQDGIKIHPRLIASVPPTTLAYDPDAMQWFDVDMICAEIFEYMSRIPEGTNQWEAMLKYIPGHTFSVDAEWIDDKDMAQALRGKGMGVSDIARQLNLPKSTVSRWTSSESVAETEDKRQKKVMERMGQEETG